MDRVDAAPTMAALPHNKPTSQPSQPIASAKSSNAINAQTNSIADQSESVDRMDALPITAALPHNKPTSQPSQAIVPSKSSNAQTNLIVGDDDEDGMMFAGDDNDSCPDDVVVEQGEQIDEIYTDGAISLILNEPQDNLQLRSTSVLDESKDTPGDYSALLIQRIKVLSSAACSILWLCNKHDLFLHRGILS